MGRRYVWGILIGIVLAATLRVVIVYHSTAEGFDEPCHAAGAMELLDHGTYNLDPYNTPLARWSIAVPLRLAGLRYPDLPAGSPESKNYIVIGNAILNSGHRLRRNLILARLGILPFLAIGTLLVFSWARLEFGLGTGLISAALFTTLPAILAFSGMAYTDMAAASMQVAAFLAFSLWLEKPTTRFSILFGVACALALLAKFTTLVYFPAVAGALVAVKWLSNRRTPHGETNPKSAYSVRQLALALLIGLVVIWGGYRFSMGHISEVMSISPQDMPSFQHFPAKVRPLARKLALSDPLMPAPSLINGILSAYVFSHSAPEGYLRGHIRSGGTWYFFLLDIALKTPLPFLVLFFAGVIATFTVWRSSRWQTQAPLVAALAILLVSTSVGVNYGIRHVLVVLPLFSIVAGYGVVRLWKVRRWRIIVRMMTLGLLAWQVTESVASRHDYIAYFNELAGGDPSYYFVAGCDLDCGQDLFRLENELRNRHVTHVSLALWTAADMHYTDLPPFSIPAPNQPVTGWFAISLRALRMGDVFHSGYPPGAFAWLNQYQPVAFVGKTILLYYIPDRPRAME